VRSGGMTVWSRQNYIKYANKMIDNRVEHEAYLEDIVNYVMCVNNHPFSSANNRELSLLDGANDWVITAGEMLADSM